MPKFYFYERPLLAAPLEENKDLRPHAEYVRRAIKHLRSRSTHNPDEADAFIVPINLIHFQFSRPAVDPWDFLRQLPHLNRGNHVLWATGDFGQRQRGRYESFHEGRAYPHLYTWLDERIRLVLFESTPDVASHDIPSIPYVLDPAGPPLWHRLLRKSSPNRDLLYSFCGALSYSPLLPEEHIRGGVFKRMAGHGTDFFIGTAADAKNIHGKNGTFQALFRRSTFTICPAGFGRWTFRLLEALHYGSIPVVISDDYVLPYANHIPWDDLILRCKESDAPTITDRLRTISAEEIRHRQDRIAYHQHHLSETGVHAQLVNDLCKLTPRLAEPPTTASR